MDRLGSSGAEVEMAPAGVNCTLVQCSEGAEEDKAGPAGVNCSTLAQLGTEYELCGNISQT